MAGHMHSTVHPNVRQKIPCPAGHTSNLKGSEAQEPGTPLGMKTAGSKFTTETIALGVPMQVYCTVGLKHFSAFPFDKFRRNISMSIL